MPTAEAAQICISNLCLNELEVDAVTAGATVGALMLSGILGFISWKFTRDDRKESRAADRERRTRVFGYGFSEPAGVRVQVINGTEFPVRNIGVWVFSYMSSPELKVLHKGTQTDIPLLGPGAEEPLWWSYAKHADLVDLRGRIGVRISFIDINGQAWVRRPDGRVLKQEELGKSAGFDLPADLYSYEGPHTER